jgi:hypothetical protein
VCGTLGYVTPADELAGLVGGSLPSAIACCGRHETIGLLASRAVQEVG